jgi:hypothetical protein
MIEETPEPQTKISTIIVESYPQWRAAEPQKPEGEGTL